MRSSPRFKSFLTTLSVIVVEPGCKVKAFQKEDGSSMVRFEMAFGKAYAALALGRSSRLVRERAAERPIGQILRLDTIAWEAGP